MSLKKLIKKGSFVRNCFSYINVITNISMINVFFQSNQIVCFINYKTGQFITLLILYYLKAK